MVIYENNIWVGPKLTFRIGRDRILSIRRISDFWKTVGFRRIRMRIRNPSHPYYLLTMLSFFCHAIKIRSYGVMLMFTDTAFVRIRQQKDEQFSPICWLQWCLDLYRAIQQTGSWCRAVSSSIRRSSCDVVGSSWLHRTPEMITHNTSQFRSLDICL